MSERLLSPLTIADLSSEPLNLFSLENNKEGKLRISGYQLSELVLFKGIREKENGGNGGALLEPFAALAGAVDSREKIELMNFSRFLLGYKGSLDFTGSLSGLADLAFDLGFWGCGQTLLRLEECADLTLLTARDLKDKKAISRLPRMVQLGLSTAGTDVWREIRDFTEKGGIISHLEFHRPAPLYWRKIKEESQGLSINEALTLVFKNPPASLKEASHQFTTIYFIPYREEITQPDRPGNFAHLTKIVNKRIDDDIEPDYARAVVYDYLLSDNMREIVFGLEAFIILTALLYFLPAQESPLIQGGIKTLVQLLSDVFSYYAKVSPWFDNKGFWESKKELWKLLRNDPDARKTLTAIGVASLTGGYGAEVAAEFFGDVAGSFVFGGVPLILEGLQSYDALKKVSDRYQQSLVEALELISRENPSQIGTNISALATLALSVGILGLGGQINNPVWVSLTEGVANHLIALLYIGYYQRQKGLSHRFKQEADKRIRRWLEELEV